MMARQTEYGKELDALRTVLDALGPLDEKQQQFVLRTAIERLNLTGAVPFERGGASGRTGSGTAPGGAGQGVAGVAGSTAKRGASGTDGAMSPQQFMRDKRPMNEVQRVAALAYYLTHHEDMADFKTGDITALSTRARSIALSNPARAVDNATRTAKVLGVAKGGRKQITTHGEEIVEALPDQERVKEVLAAFKATVRRPASRKKAAKRRKGS